MGSEPAEKELWCFGANPLFDIKENLFCRTTLKMFTLKIKFFTLRRLFYLVTNQLLNQLNINKQTCEVQSRLYVQGPEYLLLLSLEKQCSNVGSTCIYVSLVKMAIVQISAFAFAELNLWENHLCNNKSRHKYHSF